MAEGFVPNFGSPIAVNTAERTITGGALGGKMGILNPPQMARINKPRAMQKGYSFGGVAGGHIPPSLAGAERAGARQAGYSSGRVVAAPKRLQQSIASNPVGQNINGFIRGVNAASGFVPNFAEPKPYSMPFNLPDKGKGGIFSDTLTRISEGALRGQFAQMHFNNNPGYSGSMKIEDLVRLYQQQIRTQLETSLKLPNSSWTGDPKMGRVQTPIITSLEPKGAKGAVKSFNANFQIPASELFEMTKNPEIMNSILEAAGAGGPGTGLHISDDPGARDSIKITGRNPEKILDVQKRIHDVLKQRSIKHATNTDLDLRPATAPLSMTGASAVAPGDFNSQVTTKIN
jgi:hypothetical protein